MRLAHFTAKNMNNPEFSSEFETPVLVIMNEMHQLALQNMLSIYFERNCNLLKTIDPS